MMSLWRMADRWQVRLAFLGFVLALAAAGCANASESELPAPTAVPSTPGLQAPRLPSVGATALPSPSAARSSEPLPSMTAGASTPLPADTPRATPRPSPTPDSVSTATASPTAARTPAPRPTRTSAPTPAPTPTRTPTPTRPPTPTFRGAALPDPVPRRSYQGVTVYDRPIVLQGQETLEFNQKHVRFLANVTLRDQARLVFRDSLAEFVQDFHQQRNFRAEGQAEVVVERSDLLTARSINWDFRDRSRLTMLDVRKIGTAGDPWMTFADETSVTIRESEFDATIWDRASMDITRSPSVYIELVFPVGAVVDESLQENLVSFSFPGADERNINYRLNIRDSTMRGWGFTALPSSRITLRDAHNAVGTIQLNSPWENETIEFQDLKAKLYADHTMVFGDSMLRLVNVDVWFWSPTAFRNNTLIIRRSDLADLAFIGDNARIIIEQSTLYFVRGRENVRITLRDCVVYSDVIADDTSVVTLINTEVRGKIVEQGSGRVIRQ